MNPSKIEWLLGPNGEPGFTWNPITGCTKVSAGCKHCYAETWAGRGMGPWAGRKFTDVRCHHERLHAPPRKQRPSRIFVNSMSDLFHEAVPDEFIDEVFGVMAIATQHTFLVLTKRPERMRQYLTSVDNNDGGRVDGMRSMMIEGAAQARYHARTGEDPSLWLAVSMPLPNVHLGVSAEDQATADERIPILLDTPAALRWVSYEPALGPVDFTEVRALLPSGEYACIDVLSNQGYVYNSDALDCGGPIHRGPILGARLDWIVVGGESGPGARPFNVEWARSVIRQGREAGVPVFVKQLGARPVTAHPTHPGDPHYCQDFPLDLRHPKGAAPSEWPARLRVRELPA